MVAVDANQYVLVRGARQTRGALARWNEDPWPVLRSWIGGGLAVAIALLCAVWVIASVAPPDPTPLAIPGITETPGAASVLQILFGNSLVLALHAFACIAGFIAGARSPSPPSGAPASRAGSTRRRGRWRSPGWSR